MKPAALKASTQVNAPQADDLEVNNDELYLSILEELLKVPETSFNPKPGYKKVQESLCDGDDTIYWNVRDIVSAINPATLTASFETIYTAILCSEQAQYIKELQTATDKIGVSVEDLVRWFVNYLATLDDYAKQGYISAISKKIARTQTDIVDAEIEIYYASGPIRRDIGKILNYSIGHSRKIPLYIITLHQELTNHRSFSHAERDIAVKMTSDELKSKKGYQPNREEQVSMLTQTIARSIFKGRLH